MVGGEGWKRGIGRVGECRSRGGGDGVICRRVDRKGEL